MTGRNGALRWLVHGAAFVNLQVVVKPGSARRGVLGKDARGLLVGVSSVPSKGRANEELIEVLAELLGTSRSSVTIIRGRTARVKTIRIENPHPTLVGALLPRVMISIEHPVETHMTNVIGTLNVLVAARDTGVRRVVYSGSSSVYGDQPALPLKESMAPNPLNPYALQKLTGEQYTRIFHRLFGLETVTLRYFNVYGPRMTTEGAYVTVISVFLRQKRAGEPLTIHGDGMQTRDFTHVDDVVGANLLAMDASVADGRAINIGPRPQPSVNRVAELIGGPTVHLAPRPGDARDTLADISQAREILGWEPQVATEDAVRRLVRHYG